MRPRVLEAIGVRGLYRTVASVVRDTPLPSTGQAMPKVSSQELASLREGAGYFRAANLARAGCYVPQAVSFAWSSYWPGIVCVAALWALHGAMALVETYKIALIGYWADKVPADPPSAMAEPLYTPPAGFFRLRAFETPTFYRWLGLEQFRRFVTWMMSTLAFGVSQRRMAYLTGARGQLAQFEAGTRVSEVVHWASAASITPLVALSWTGAPLGVALWSTFILWGDLMLALLQRYHRARVMPLLKKMVVRT